MVIVFLPVTLAAIVGLAYASVLTYREVRAANAAGWRRTVPWLSVSAVTAQLLVFGAMLLVLALTNSHHAITRIAWAEVLFFLIALPCAVLRKGFARWGLLFSSIYFLGFAGFVYLVSGITF